jgi:hypothetical protein
MLMETAPLERYANLIGFVAYNFAVGGGWPDRKLLAAALEGPDTKTAPARPRPPEPTEAREIAA